MPFTGKIGTIINNVITTLCLLKISHDSSEVNKLVLKLKIRIILSWNSKVCT